MLDIRHQRSDFRFQQSDVSASFIDNYLQTGGFLSTFITKYDII